MEKTVVSELGPPERRGANKKIIILSLLVVILIASSASYLLLTEGGKEESVCNEDMFATVGIVNGFINGTEPSSLSALCNSLYSDDRCKSYFYHFLLYKIKNNVSDAFDTNSPIMMEFLNYLRIWEPEVNIGTPEDIDIVASSFKSGKPIDNGYSGLNAAITRNSSFCNQEDISKRNNCINEIKFLNAVSVEQCREIGYHHLYLLCIQGISQEEYLIELNKCGI